MFTRPVPTNSSQGNFLSQFLNKPRGILKGQNIGSLILPLNEAKTLQKAPKLNVADKIPNPILRLLASIPQNIINAPSTTAQGLGELGQEVQTGDLKPTHVLASAAKTLEAPLTVTGVGSVAKSVGKETLKKAIKQGIKSGAKTGGVFGAITGLEQNKNANSLIDQLIKTAPEVVKSAAVGAAAGGATPIVARGAKIAASELGDAGLQPGFIKLGKSSAKGGSKNQQTSKKGTLPKLSSPQSPLPEGQTGTTQVSGSEVPTQPIPGEQPQLGSQVPQIPEQIPGQTQSSSSQTSSTSIPPTVKERGLITSIKGAKGVAPQIKEGISGSYEVQPHEVTKKAASDILQKGEADAVSMVNGTAEPTAITNELGRQLVTKMQNEGRHQEAVNLIEGLANKSTNQGQAIDILKLWGQLTPEGALKYTQTLVNKANSTRARNTLKITPELAKEISDSAAKVQSLSEGRSKDVATGELVEKMYSAVPKNLLQKISSIQTFAQLLNPKTAIRNTVGNLGFAGAENVSDVVGTPIDMVTSLITGKRTKTLPSVGAQTKGFGLGLKEGIEDAYKGINTLGTQGGQIDLTPTRTFTKGSLLGKLETGLNLELRATDRAFYKAAYDGSLNNQMRAAKVTIPTEDMLSTAHNDALYRTFQDTNVGTKLFQGLKRALNLGQDFGLGDLIIKYPRTPASLIMRGVDYSPANFAKVVFEASAPLFGKKFDQKSFVEAFSRAITGTTGTIITGYMLNKLGIITGKPNKDTDVRGFQRTAGLGQYRINASALKRLVTSGFNPNSAKTKQGDVQVSYDWFQPLAIGLSMGANIGENGVGKTVNNPASPISTLLTSLGEGVDTLTQQPLVSGIQQLFNKKSITEGLAQTAKNAPASFVPSLFSQINQATDNTSRETHSPDIFQESMNLAKNKIPGLAETLPKKYDVLGKEAQRYQDNSNNIFNVFVNPAFLSKVKTDPGAKEVLNLVDTTGETKQVPREVDKSIKINGQSKNLTGEELSRYQKYIGETTNAFFNQLATTPEFQKKSDSDKIKEMTSALSDINSAAKIELFGNKPARFDNGAEFFLQFRQSHSLKSGTGKLTRPVPKL